jgi:hypothetical protein
MNTIKRFICLGLMPIAILSISASSKGATGATVEGSKGKCTVTSDTGASPACVVLATCTTSCQYSWKAVPGAGSYIVKAVKAAKAAIPQPNPRYTPGVVDHTLTKATLCSPLFHTRTKRRVTRPQKVAVCAQYGITRGCPGPGYELDDLISIELGGLNVPRNQWPQPKDGPGVIGFHTKDLVENRAHAAVCRPGSTLTLDEAQQGIASDWYEFGIKNGFIK